MQDSKSETEERLREAASIGDLDSLDRLCQTVNVNSQNNINSWTALHWGAKRNHLAVVKILLQHGADKNIRNNKDEVAAQLTGNTDILELLGCEHKLEPTELVEQSELPITPNYIANPPFPHTTKNHQTNQKEMSVERPGSYELNHKEAVGNRKGVNGSQGAVGKHSIVEIVLKARVANIEETDFIEVELDRANLTFVALVQLLCAELNVDSKLIQKVRKRPDTILRKDKDVTRLRDFQEIELVLSNKAQSSLSRNYGTVSGNYNGIGTNLKQEQILY